MKSIQVFIQKIKENKNDVDLINEIIIKLTQDPDPSYLEIVDFLIDTISREDLRKININLVYLLGELGKSIHLDQNYIKYLIDTFYNSDRWIRTEVLKSLEKINKVMKTNNKIIPLLSTALNEEYEVNNIQALKVLFKLDDISDQLFRSFLVVLNKGTPGLKQYIYKLMNKHLQDETIIFTLLNKNNNYQVVKSHGFRLILQSLLPYTHKINSFQTLIEQSNWTDPYKSSFLNDIKTIKNLIKKG